MANDISFKSPDIGLLESKTKIGFGIILGGATSKKLEKHQFH